MPAVGFSARASKRRLVWTALLCLFVIVAAGCSSPVRKTYWQQSLKLRTNVYQIQTSAAITDPIESRPQRLEFRAIQEAAEIAADKVVDRFRILGLRHHVHRADGELQLVDVRQVYMNVELLPNGARPPDGARVVDAQEVLDRWPRLRTMNLIKGDEPLVSIRQRPDREGPN